MSTTVFAQSSTPMGVSNNETSFSNTSNGDDTRTTQSNGNILLVDNDASHLQPYINVDIFYTEALTKANYNYTEWDVIDHNGYCPNVSLMQQYDAVVWFTGTRYSQCIPVDAQVYLSEYLEGEGRLFISGQDIGYNLQYSEFYRDYLRAEYLGTFNDDMNPLPWGGFRVDGESQDIIGGDLSFGLTWVNTYSGYWFKPDAISPRSGASSCFYYRDSNIAYKGGIKTAGLNSRTIYLSFGLESIDNFNDRAIVLARSLAWICENEETLIIEIDSPDTGIVGQTLLFSGSASGGISPYYSWHWNFGDGFVYQGQDVSHVYDNAGVYTITLTVKDSDNPQNIVSVQSTISVEYDSLLEIEEVQNRFLKMGVTAEIKNSGHTVVTDVQITMNITGGLRNQINIINYDSTSILYPGETAKLNSDVFFGFGLIGIDVIVDASNAAPITRRITGFIVGPFVMLNYTSSGM